MIRCGIPSRVMPLLVGSAMVLAPLRTHAQHEAPAPAAPVLDCAAAAELATQATQSVRTGGVAYTAGGLAGLGAVYGPGGAARTDAASERASQAPPASFTLVPQADGSTAVLMDAPAPDRMGRLLPRPGAGTALPPCESTDD